MNANDYIIRHKHILTFFVLALAAFFLFRGTMHHKFNSDDYLAIYHALREPNASLLQSLSELARPSWGLYYRPGIKIFLEILAKLFGLQPAGYHLVSLLCYAVLCFETYLLGFLLTERWRTAFGAGIIFLSLGVHGEAMFWISSLNGVVENILTLASLICFIRWHRNNKRILLAFSLLFFVTALLTKESAISLPILLICYSFLLGGEVQPGLAARRTIMRCWPFVLVGVLFVVLRTVVMRQADLPPALTHFEWQFLIIGPWHAFLMTLSPIDWPIPVHYFGRFISMGTFAFIIAAIGLAAIALVPLALRKYRVTFLVWWIPAAAAPLFALGLVPSERHLIISSVGASILVSLALFRLSEWFGRGAKPLAIAMSCTLMIVFCASGLYSLKQRQRAWAYASVVADHIVGQTVRMYPAPEKNTTFFFLNVPDSIDGAFVFRFENLGYALRLFYKDDSIEVIRIVALDKMPYVSPVDGRAAYFRIGALGGHIYLPDNHLQSPRLREQWERLEREEILTKNYQLARDGERYAGSPFLVYAEKALAPSTSDELRRVLQNVYSLL